MKIKNWMSMGHFIVGQTLKEDETGVQFSGFFVANSTWSHGHPITLWLWLT
jgi:hypothetical protein